MTHRHALHSTLRLSLAALLLAAAGSTCAQTSKPEAATTPGNVVTTDSGLVFKLIKQGTGPSPLATDTVKVHYRGTFMDGKT